LKCAVEVASEDEPGPHVYETKQICLLV